MSTQVLMDLAVGDVHTAGGSSAPATPAPKTRRRAKAPVGKTPAVRIRGELGPGGHIHVRHISANDRESVEAMPDGTTCLRDTRRITSGEAIAPADANVTLVGPGTWKDGSPKSLVWVQVAEMGAWKGHGSGVFEMTSKTFDEIVANFNARGLPIQWDMEHASEQESTSGSIPVTGAPAQGWIHRLDNRAVGGLWALTEWLDYARDGIQEGKFAWCSPAVRFGCKDGVTGKPIGARLTSAAITGSPFLTGLKGLIAAKDTPSSAASEAFVIAGGPKPLLAVLMAAKGGGAMAHKPHEYMPTVRRSLGLHELSTPQQCADHLEQLRDHVEACGDAEGMHQGADLGAYTRPLRSLVDAQPGDTWDDVFDAVEGLIQAAIADHEAKFHAGETPANPIVGANLDDDESGESDMTLSDADKITKITSLETENATLKVTLGEEKVKLDTVTKRVAELEGASKAAAFTLTLKDGETPAVVVAREFGITLKDGETIPVAIKRIVEENTKLLADKALRDAEILNADVEIAFDTYKVQRNLKDADKPHLLAHAKADRTGFQAMYPFVAASERHLLTNLVQPEKRPDPKTLEEQANSPTAQIQKLMKDEGIGYAEAQIRIAKKKKS